MVAKVLTVEGKSIAEVWEKSVMVLWEKGAQIKTEYDQPDDPFSRDATMVMVVNEPFSEPRIHLGFPGGMEDLEKYRQEVVLGVHDHWIKPEEGKWTYTYHQRLFNYPVSEGNTVNQVEYIIDKLSRVFYTRRAQAITWVPSYDPETDDPPCLQRIWCRIVTEKDNHYLRMNTHWRSRDAYRAAYMNLFGLTELQKYIADEISKRTGKEILVGPYVDITDAYHIYGSNFCDFKDRFLKMMDTRDFYNQDRLKSRTMRSDDPAVIAGFEYGRQLLENEKKP
ncbi:MAG TPA: thymidylate synthase [bacterium]|nr:thymidylate synthase [bacterium]HXK45093.1 thymidylate synthase [bacterium]